MLFVLVLVYLCVRVCAFFVFFFVCIVVYVVYCSFLNDVLLLSRFGCLFFGL